VSKGDALFAQSDHVDIHVGAAGMVALVAYTGAGPVPHLLKPITKRDQPTSGGPNEIQMRTSLTQTKAAPKNGRLEPIK